METKKRSGNSGIPVGFTFATLLVLAHIMVDMLNDWDSQGDFILWLLRLAIYFVAALIASNAQYKSQIDADSTFTGVANAGRGAAMIICVILWIYIIVRSIVLDDGGMFAGGGVLAFLGFMLLDFVFALALGSWGGRVIEKRNEYMLE